MKATAVRIVAFVAAVASGFSPDLCARSFSFEGLPEQRRRRRRRSATSRLFGVAQDARGLLRDASAYARAYLPLFPDEVVEIVPPDYDSIKDSLRSSDSKTERLTPHHIHWL